MATTYPLLDHFSSMLISFGFIVWIWLLAMIFSDIFRSHDVGGPAKAMWVLFVVVIPLLGVFAYLVARGHGMTERSARRARREHRAFDGPVRQAAGGSSADRLAEPAQLRDAGQLSDEGFTRAKAWHLGRPRPVADQSGWRRPRTDRPGASGLPGRADPDGLDGVAPIARRAAVSLDAFDPAGPAAFYRALLDLESVVETEDVVALRGAGVLLATLIHCD